jgi:hypothetical protein
MRSLITGAAAMKPSTWRTLTTRTLTNGTPTMRTSAIIISTPETSTTRFFRRR